jgi:pSer/pThr/pTyr-binding forkhead associated (FHA) protein
MARNVLVLKHFESPKEAGTYHRLVCLTGGNKGESYVLLGSRIVIGRSEKADIKLTDVKTSREHAELTKVADKWVATDLGSQNGIVVNDKKVTQQELKEGDKLIIGTTVFKFAKVEVSGGRGKVVKEDSSKDKAEGGNKAFVPFIILVLIFAGLFLIDDSPKKVAPKSKNSGGKYQDMNNEYVIAIQKRQANENKQLKEKLTVIYQRGLRELRERNYYRAIHEFNLALIIAPGDAQAEYYLRKTKEQLDKEIEGFTANAQRDEESLKFKNSIIAYCAIIRLLYSVPDDPRHKNAIKQIEELESKLGIEKGETDCLKKQRASQ